MAAVHPRLRRIALWTGAIVAGLVALAALLLVYVDTGPGHRTLARLVGGFAPANGLRVDVGRIEGSIYGRMVLHDLELRDPQGVFLTSPEVVVDWRPLALAANHLDIREASSDLVTVLRRPAFTPTPVDPNRPLLPSMAITIGKLDFGRIVLEAPVVGRPQTASLAGTADIAGGHALLDLSAEAQPVDGQGGGDLLRIMLDAEPDSDRLDIDARLEAPMGGVVAGLASLDQPLSARIAGAGSWANWNGTAQADLGQDRLAALQLSARDGDFRILGRAQPAALAPASLARLLQPAVDLDLRAKSEGGRIDTDFRARSSALDVAAKGGFLQKGSRFDNLQLNVRVLRPAALLDNVAGRNITLSARLDGPTGSPRIRYTLNADAIGFGETLVQQLRAEGDFRLEPERTTIPIHATAARVSGVGEAVGGVLARMQLDGDVVMTRGRLASDNLRLRSDRLNATLVFTADLATGQYTASLKGEIQRYEAPGIGLFNLSTDASVLPAPGGGFTIGGTFRLQTLRIDNGALADLLGGDAVASGAYRRAADGALSISNLRLESPALQVLDGSGRLGPDGALDFTASARSARYGPVTVAADGSLAQPVIRLRAPAPRIGVPLTDVEVVLNRAGDGYTITAKGMSPYGPLDVEAALQAAGGPLALDVRRGRFAGLNITGRLQQTAAGPFAGTLQVESSGFEGSLRLSAAGDVQRADLTLNADNARAPLAEPVLIAEGSVQATVLLRPDAPEAAAKAQFKGVRRGDLRVDEAAASLDYRNGSGRVQLTANGRSGVPFTLAADAALTPDLIRADIKGTANRIPVSLANPAELRRVDGGWRLAPVTVVTPQGRMQLAGTFGDATALTARLQSLDLSIAQAFAPRLGIDGKATGTANFTLPPGGAAPVGRIQLSIEDFTRSGLATTSDPVDIAFVGEIAPASVTANAVIRRRSVVIGRLQARLAPVAPGGAWMDRLKAAPLTGGLRYNGPAEVLWALTAMQGQQVSGPIALGADFTGTLGQPRTEGVLHGKGMTYQNQAYGTIIRDLAVEGRLNGSRLELSSLSGRAGDGTIQGTGYVDLAADRGFPMDLRLKVAGARLAASDDLSAEVTGDLTIANDRDEGARITGGLAIDEARYRIARQGAAEVPELTGVRRRGTPPPGDRPEAAPGAGLPGTWRLDIQVRGDNRIFVTGMGLEAEWQASLHLGGTLQSPTILGDIRAVRGTYAFAGRRLELTRGIIRFDGGSPPDPRLDIQASTSVEGVTATISITGRALNPQIDFASTPALPQDEVLSRLLFGSSVTELSATQALQLAASLNSLRGGGGGLNPLGALRQATGIDRLRVISGDQATGQGTALAAGKYITNNVYVEVTTDARGFTAIQLEIALTRSLSLLSQIGSFGGTNLNLRYSKDY